MEKSNVKSEIVEAFHLMWDNYPSVVMLLNKAREIIAVNSAGANAGISPGIKCHTLNKIDHICPECKANKALTEGTAQKTVAYVEPYKMVMESYWVPLAGSDALYVHFGNNISEYAKSELFPENAQ